MGEFEKAQAVLQVLAVGLLVRAHALAHVEEFLLPLGRQLLAHVGRNLTVVAILVELPAAFDQARFLRFERGERLLVVFLFVGHALLERDAQGLREAGIELQRGDGVAELLGDRLFTHVLALARTGPPAARAVVVGVPFLAALRGDLAAAVGAGEQSGEGERPVLEVAAVAAAHDGLHLVEQLA